jgi:hypothetical protein
MARSYGGEITPRKALAVSGIPVAELVSFDQAMMDYMKGRGIRAGVLAVAKDGHLVLSRGYGYMDNVGDVFGVSSSGDMFFGPPAGVPGPYGAFSTQTMESHGGLVRPHQR